MKKQKRKKKVNIIFVVILAAVITAATFAICYVEGLFLPDWIEWKEKSIHVNGNTLCSLDNRKLKVTYDDSEYVWRVPGKIKCQDFYIEDIDGDGLGEIILLCWKIGRYGKHRPFFVDRDELKWSQHIYIYTLDKNDVSQKWMASDIGMLVKDITVDNATVHITDINGKETDWGWRSFGLQIRE